MRPALSVLDPSLIKRIIDEAKIILASVGIEVRGPLLRRFLVDRGLPVDATGQRILFPPEVVDQAISDAPREISLCDRTGELCAVLGEDRVHFAPGSSGLKVLDHRTDSIRSAATADFVEYARVADGLKHIAFLATAFSTGDIEPQVADAWRLYLCLTQSRKPVVSGAFTEHGVPLMAELMALFRRDRADLAARPMAIFTVTATGNFRYNEDSCQNLLDCVDWGIPIEVVPVTLMGLIAPVTVLGAAVFHTVDVLAGITMAQVIRPGTPVLFGGAPATFHMREATAPMAAVEALRLGAVYAAVGKHLDLPTQAYTALSDSKFLDAQAGAETFGSALVAVLAGINSVSGPGMLDYLTTFSLPKLVFDDELCGQALAFVKAMEPAADLPSLGLVRALMQEQHLLTAEHTLAHWPRHLYLPGPVIDRQGWDTWRRAGGQTLQKRAIVEVERLLEAYEPVQIDARIDTEMRRLIQSAMEVDNPLPVLPEGRRLLPSAEPAQRSRRRRRT